MQVENDAQLVRISPLDGPVEILEVFVESLSGIRFEQFVVEGKPHMVKTPGGDLCEILFGDERFVAVF